MHVPVLTAATVATFSVASDPCPQLLCRLLGLIAQQDRTVRTMRADTTARTQRVSIVVPNIDRNRAEIIADKMRGFVAVRRVTLRCAI